MEMLKVKNRILSILVALFCLFTAMGFVMFGASFSVTAAEDPEPHAGENFWIDGATLRLNDENHPNAITFYADVRSEYFVNYFKMSGDELLVDNDGVSLTLKDGIESRFILLPTDLLGQDPSSGNYDSINVNTAGRGLVNTTNAWFKKVDSKGNVFAESKVVLWNIPSDQFGREFACACCFVDSNGQYTYSQNSDNQYSLGLVTKGAIDEWTEQLNELDPLATDYTVIRDELQAKIDSIVNNPACDKYYKDYSVSYYVDGALYGAVQTKNFKDAHIAAPTKAGCTFEGWKNTITGKVDTVVKGVSYAAKWSINVGESGAPAETDKPISYYALQSTGFDTKEVVYLSGESGPVGYKFDANGGVPTNPQVRFDTATPFGTDGFSFNYRLLNDSTKAMETENNARYVVKVLYSEYGVTKQKTLEFAPNTTGTEGSFSVDEASAFIEGGTFEDVADAFLGFMIKMGDLDGELLVYNVNVLKTSFSSLLTVDLGYTSAGTSALASSKVDIENLPIKALEDGTSAIKAGETAVNFISSIGGYKSVVGMTFAMDNGDVGVTLGTSYFSILAGHEGESGILTITVLGNDDKNHDITVPVFVITKGIYTPEDLKGFNAVAGSLNVNNGGAMGYYRLMNNIDFTGYKFQKADSYSEDHNTRFMGTFDGNGHVIDNFTITDVADNQNYGFIGYFGETGVLKNVAFTNVVTRQNLSFNRGCVGYGTPTLENVYIKYRLFSSNEAGTGNGGNCPTGVWSTAYNGAFIYNNVVIDFSTAADLFEQNNSGFNGNYGKYFGNFSEATINNLALINVPSKYTVETHDGGSYYPISIHTSYDGTSAKYWNETEIKNKGIYIAFNDDSTNGLTIDEDAWNETYWKINDAGVPEFSTHTHTFTYEYKTDSVHIKSCKDGDFAVEEAHTFTWVRNDQGFVNKCLCGYVSDSFGMNDVIPTQYVDISDSLVLNSNIDLGYGSIDAMTVKYLVNGEEVTTFANLYAKVGNGEHVVTVKIGADIEEEVKVVLVDGFISNEQDFLNLKNVIAGRTDNDGYFVLTDDINLTTIIANGATIDNRIARFTGTIDGNGHTVSNIIMYGEWHNWGWIQEFVGATLKNIAFTDVYMGGSAGLLGVGYGTFENFYIHYGSLISSTSKSNSKNYSGTSGLFLLNDNMINTPSTLKNVVFDLTTASPILISSGLGTVAEQSTYVNYTGNFSANSLFENVVVLNFPKFRLPNVMRFGLNGPFGDGSDYGIYTSYYEDGTTNGVAFPTTGWDSTFWTVSGNEVSFDHAHDFITPVFYDTNTHTLACGCEDASLTTSHQYKYEILEDGKLRYYCSCGSFDKVYNLNVKPIEYTDLNCITNEGMLIPDWYYNNGNFENDKKLTALFDFGGAFNSDEFTSVDIYVGNTKYTAKTFGDIAFGSDANFDDVMEFEVRAVDKDGVTVIFKQKVAFVTKFIHNETEFLSIKDYSNTFANGYNSAHPYAGYYVLANDITLTSKFYSLSNATTGIDNRIMVFKGTIDGLGHTVSGMNLDTTWINNSFQGGWIDSLQGGSIKNVALTNVVLCGPNAVLVSRGYGTIENVYVKLAYNTGYIDQSTTIMFSGADCDASKTFIKNVVFDYSAMTDRINKDTGSRARFFGGISNGTSVENAIILGLPILHKYHVLESNKTASDGSALGIYVKYSDNTTNGVAFPTTGWDESFWKMVDGKMIPKGISSIMPSILPDVEIDLGAYVNGSTVSVRDGSFTVYLTDIEDEGIVEIRDAIAYGDAHFHATDISYGNRINVPYSVFASYLEKGGNVTLYAVTADNNLYPFEAEIITKGIYTPEDLKTFTQVAAKLRNGDNNKGTVGYYKVMNDIDFDGYTLVKADIKDFADGYNERFNGTFDGAGHIIDNLKLVDPAGSWGFFGYMGEKGIIKNVAFTNMIMKSNVSFNMGSYYGAKIVNSYFGFKIFGATDDGSATADYPNPVGMFLTNGDGTIEFDHVVFDFASAGIALAKKNYLNTNYGKYFGSIKNATFKNTALLNVPAYYQGATDDNGGKYAPISIKIPYASHKEGEKPNEVTVVDQETRYYTAAEIAAKGLYVSLTDGTNNGAAFPTGWDTDYWQYNGTAVPTFRRSNVDYYPDYTAIANATTVNYRQDLDLAATKVGNALVTNNNVTLNLNSVKDSLGATADVSLEGTTIASNVAIVNNTITFNTSSIPTTVYGEKDITITTGGNTITAPVLVITKGIYNYDDLKSYSEISRLIRTDFINPKTGDYHKRDGSNFVHSAFGGYFKLMQDIENTNNEEWTQWVSQSQSNNPDEAFIGTIDGGGHTFKGYRYVSYANEASLIGYFLAGTIKNINFTDVTLRNKGALIVYGPNGYQATFQGYIENVNVSYKEIYAGGNANTLATFVRGGGQIYMRDCIVDLTNANFTGSYGFVAIGIPYDINTYCEGVYVIGLKDKMSLASVWINTQEYFTYDAGAWVDYKIATGGVWTSMAGEGTGKDFTNGIVGAYATAQEFINAYNGDTRYEFTIDLGNSKRVKLTSKTGVHSELNTWNKNFWSILDAKFMPSIEEEVVETPKVTVKFVDTNDVVKYSYSIDIDTAITAPMGIANESGLLKTYSFKGWSADGVTFYTQGQTLPVANCNMTYKAYFETGYEATKLAQEEGDLLVVYNSSTDCKYSLYRASGKDNNPIMSYYITANGKNSELAFKPKSVESFAIDSLTFNYRWANEASGTPTANVYSINASGTRTLLGSLDVKTGSYGTFTYGSAISDFAGFVVVFNTLNGEFLLNAISVGHEHGDVEVLPFTKIKSDDNASYTYYCTCGKYLGLSAAPTSKTTVGTVTTLINTNDGSTIYQINTVAPVQYIDLGYGLDGSFNAQDVGLDISKFVTAGNRTVKGIYLNGVKVSSNSKINTGTLRDATGEVILTVEVVMAVEPETTYTVTAPVFAVTKLIKNKTDLDNIYTYSAAYATAQGHDGELLGYFALGKDIDYNGDFLGLYTPSGGSAVEINHTYVPTSSLMVNGDYNANLATFNTIKSFNGVIDGNGYAIKGMNIISSYYPYIAFVPKLGDNGVIKNISFTGANLTRTSYLTAGGTGRIEDVYVSYNHLGYDFNYNVTGPNSLSAQTSLIGYYNESATKLSNVIIDLTADTQYASWKVPNTPNQWLNCGNSKKDEAKPASASGLTNGLHYVFKEAEGVYRLYKINSGSFGSPITSYQTFMRNNNEVYTLVAGTDYYQPLVIDGVAVTYQSMAPEFTHFIGGMTVENEHVIDGVYIIGANRNAVKPITTYDQVQKQGVSLSEPLKGNWGTYLTYDELLENNDMFNTSAWANWSLDSNGNLKHGNTIVKTGISVTPAGAKSGNMFNTDGTTDYELVVGDSDQAIKAAGLIATQLQRAYGEVEYERYMERVGVQTSPSSNVYYVPRINGGLNLESVKGATWSDTACYIVVGDEALASAAGLTIENDVLIKKVGKSYFVMAKNPADYEAAALLFLNELVGYNALSVDNIVFDSAKVLTGAQLPLEEINTNIAISNRDYVNNVPAALLDYMGYSNRSYYTGPSDNTVWHNSFTWVTEEERGARPNIVSSNGLQLCYTAHGNASDYDWLVTTIANRVADRLKVSKSKNVSFTQQDEGSIICECNVCKTKTQSYNILKFINDVCNYIDNHELYVGEYTLNFFAYGRPTETPPTDAEFASLGTINSHAGVILAPRRGYYAQSVYSTDNAGYRANMEQFARYLDHVGVWFYCATYSNYLIPYNCFETMITWIEYAARILEADWLFFQGNSVVPTNAAFMDFKEFINSKACVEVLDKVPAYNDGAVAYNNAVKEYLKELEELFFGIRFNDSGTAYWVDGLMGYYGPSNVGVQMYSAYKAQNTLYNNSLARLKADKDRGFLRWNGSTYVAFDNGASFGEVSDVTSDFTGLGSTVEYINAIIYQEKGTWSWSNAKYYYRGNSFNEYKSYVDKVYYPYLTLNDVNGVLSNFSNITNVLYTDYVGRTGDPQVLLEYEMFYDHVIAESLPTRYLVATCALSAAPNNEQGEAMYFGNLSYWYRHIGEEGQEIDTGYGMFITKNGAAAMRALFKADMDRLYLDRLGEDVRTSVYQPEGSAQQGRGLYLGWGLITASTPVPVWARVPE